MISAQIEEKSLVGLRTSDYDPDTKNRLRLWIKFYGRGPFFVKSKPTKEHVVLVDKNGKMVNFGSTGHFALNINYVEPWRFRPFWSFWQRIKKLFC
jgi:hypothetical protein